MGYQWREGAFYSAMFVIFQGLRSGHTAGNNLLLFFCSGLLTGNRSGRPTVQAGISKAQTSNVLSVALRLLPRMSL
jgi:hypothetical protein